MLTVTPDQLFLSVGPSAFVTVMSTNVGSCPRTWHFSGEISRTSQKRDTQDSQILPEWIWYRNYVAINH